MARKGLGRGIDSLIPMGLEAEDRPVTELEPSAIEPDPLQPRQRFDDETLAELAASLSEHGVIQPLIVRKVGQTYRLVAGERRLRAATLLGMKTVPVVVRTMGDREAMEVSLVENLQREELDPLEQASAFQRLMKEFGMTQEEVASRVGKSRSEVANSVRLLRLEPEVQALIAGGKISGGHGRALVGLEHDEQARIAGAIVSKGLSVRMTEEMVARRKKAESVKRRTVTSRRRDAERIVSEALGTPVQVMVQGQKGTISISFFGEEDLERIVEIVLKGVGK